MLTSPFFLDSTLICINTVRNPFARRHTRVYLFKRIICIIIRLRRIICIIISLRRTYLAKKSALALLARLLPGSIVVVNLSLESLHINLKPHLGILGHLNFIFQFLDLCLLSLDLVLQQSLGLLQFVNLCNIHTHTRRFYGRFPRVSKSTQMVFQDNLGWPLPLNRNR
jgi:hypothetical protein